jgi:hypothetical protein
MVYQPAKRNDDEGLPVGVSGSGPGRCQVCAVRAFNGLAGPRRRTTLMPLEGG